MQSFLRFTVPSSAGNVESATLRLFVTNGGHGPEVYLTSNDWSESSITWNNKPSQSGSPIARLDGVSTGWLEIDLTDAINSSGTYSILMIPGGSNGVDFHSREGSNKPELIVTTSYDGGDGDADGDSDGDGDGDSEITHVGTTEVWDRDGQNLTIARPSGSEIGDLLILFLHRTDDDLPLFIDGWTRVAECYKKRNGFDCSLEEDCIRWHNDDFCGTFGDHGEHSGHDLAQSVFYRRVRSGEPSSYNFDLNRDSSGHPGWAILTALRGADASDPVRDWSHEGCDHSRDSVFPSVYGEEGDMVLLSQSFDDAVSDSRFRAPDGTDTFGYVSRSDEAGFLFGGILISTGNTDLMRTQGDGAAKCKDALISLTVRANSDR